MRRLFALIVVGLLTLTVALAAVGCGKKAEETSTMETTPSPEPMMSDTMMSDTAAMDTSMHQ